MARMSVAIAGAVVLMTGAILAQGVQPPPPEFQKLMRQISPTSMGIGKKLDAKDYAGVAIDAASLSTLFADVQTFWKTRGAEDAIKSAEAAIAASTALSSAAKAMNDNAIAEARKNLTAQCQA